MKTPADLARVPLALGLALALAAPPALAQEPQATEEENPWVTEPWQADESAVPS